MITVIGNGESRKTIDIDKIQGIRVGCNALYLYHRVEYICAMDKFWRDKISKESNIPLISRLHNAAFQTTLELFNGRWQSTECPYRGYCSGVTAMDYLSYIYKNQDIYLIGFDFDYTGDKVNHMYKGTENHPKADRPAQSESLFLKQCIETVKRYPRHRYHWVSDSNFNNGFDKITIDVFKEIAY